MPSIKPISEYDVATFLAGKKRSQKKISKRSKAKEVAHSFVEQFHIQNLMDVLVYKKTPITLGWIVKEWLCIYDSPKTPSATQMAILDRLKELVLIGAVQDPELLEEIKRLQTHQGSGKGKPKTADPFAGEKLRFLKA